MQWVTVQGASVATHQITFKFMAVTDRVSADIFLFFTCRVLMHGRCQETDSSAHLDKRSKQLHASSLSRARCAQPQNGKWGRDVAQLVEHRTTTPPTQVRFPGAARDFFLPESTFSADSLTVSVRPRAQSHAFISVRTSKIPWSMSEFGGLWKHLNAQHEPKAR